MKKSGSGFLVWLKQSVVTLIIGLIISGVFASPSFSALFPIATTGAAQSYSFDGSKYLVGIENHLTSPSSIGAQMLNSDGTKSGSLIPTGRTGIATNVAFDGTNYLLIWEDDNGGASNGTTGWQVWGQRISKAGAAVGSPFAISSTGIWFDGARPMTFGGGKYLVTYTKLIVPANGDNSTNRYIAGRIVNPDGTMGSEFRISTGYGKSSDVAFDGSKFFVVWCEDFGDTEVRGRFVSTAGVPDTEFSINASAAPSDNPTSVAFDGTNYLVVWNDEVGGQGTGTWDVYGQLVSPGGAKIGGVITITNEPGPQMATSVAFDGANYMAAWMDMKNDANGNAVCDTGEGTCWDMYGQYISQDGKLVGGKIVINTDAGNQMGGVGFANGKYMAIVNSGVVMGQGGINQVGSANALFITPPTPGSYTGGGTFTYTGSAPSGVLTFNFTNSNFICNGPGISSESHTITSFTATTFTWSDSDNIMTWTRTSGTAGDLTGTWTSTDPGSGNTYTLTFSGPTSGTLSVTGSVLHCSPAGPLTPFTFTPSSGYTGNLISITGGTFSPIATDNTVLFNGVPAMVKGVRPGQLSVLVPPGATTGPITISTSNGTVTSSTSFTITQSSPATTLAWGGVHHRFDSDGSAFDALDVGINSYATTIDGMTLTVNGPNNFTYTFTDADISQYINGQLALYKKYPTPATPLAAGVYTFTLNDGLGHISHRVDTHVTVVSLPQVDSTTIQLQRKADGSYRFSWAPLNDTKTYYYRLRINRNNNANTPVYDSTRAMTSYADVPAGILFDDSTYKVRVEAVDSPNGDLATNSSRSAWKLFSPNQSDYVSGKLLVNDANIWNRIDSDNSQSTDAILYVNDPTTLASAIATDADALQLLNSSGTVIYRFTTVDRSLESFYKKFTAATTPTTLSPGAYSIRFRLSNTAPYSYSYVNLTTRVDYPRPDTSTMQAEDLGDGNIRFSWSNINGSGALFYRVMVSDTGSGATGLLIASPRQNQTFADLSISSINTLGPNKQWRVEVSDSNNMNTQRNRSNSAYISFVPKAFDPTNPVISNVRVRNQIKSTGAPFSQVIVAASGSQSTLSQILVTNSAGYNRNLLATGRYSPAYGAYLLEEAGTLSAGLYTVTVTNNAGKTALKYMYVTPANPLPQPDFSIAHIDTEPNGDTRLSWAPVLSSVPVWYGFRMYSQTDQNSDGLVDGIYSQTVNSSSNFQQTSIVIPAGAITVPATGQISVFDGSGSTVVSNISQSIFFDTVGNSVPDPFTTGNDSLTASVTGISPANNATGIPTTGSTFSVTFNKVIDQRTLPASFTINNGITGSVTYNPSTRTATFIPSSQLLPGTTYTATISTSLKDQAGNSPGAPYSWSFTTAGSLPLLSVTVTGNGNINSNTGTPGIHATTPGSYSSPYAWNDPVTLTATLSTGYYFSGWGGDGTCTGTGTTCTFNMNANKTVTATFLVLVQDNARIAINGITGTTPYGTVLAAYNSATTTNPVTVIKLRDKAFDEPLNADNGVAVILSGGYAADFATRPGVTSITSLIISLGSLTIDNLTIK